MDIHAYPTEAPTLVDKSAAHRIADRYLTSDDYTERGITNRINEFDTCFVVTAVFPSPPSADPNAPAVVVGGSVCVIDKSTGAVSYWPTYPPELVADRYAAALRDDRLIIEDGWPEDDWAYDHEHPDSAHPPSV